MTNIPEDGDGPNENKMTPAAETSALAPAESGKGDAISRGENGAAEAGASADPTNPATAKTGDALVGGSPRRTYIQKLAHELKTPISAIAVAAEVMRDEQLGPIGDARYTQYAADIHDSAKLMLAIIDRMMAQRGREAPRDPMEFVEMDALGLIHATVSAMLPLARRSDIRLRVVEAEEPLPRVIADQVSLRQMLLNLITNAMKFTPAGGSVAVTARYNPEVGLSFEVADTGPGMTQEALAAAREGRVEGQGARPGGGLGLGLPLVRTLAATNGAALLIDSQPGSGTKARIVFPQDRLVLS